MRDLSRSGVSDAVCNDAQLNACSRDMKTGEEERGREKTEEAARARTHRLCKNDRQAQESELRIQKRETGGGRRSSNKRLDNDRDGSGGEGKRRRRRSRSRTEPRRRHAARKAPGTFMSWPAEATEVRLGMSPEEPE